MPVAGHLREPGGVGHQIYRCHLQTRGFADGADGLWTGCKAMADLTVLDTAEADCFTKGKGPEDWKKCNFKTTGALNMFAISADAYAKSLKSGCGDSDGGDDDDDAPKKKKKKKGDDD